MNDIAKINTEAAIVNNYEAWFVGTVKNFRFEATGYISKSELGANSVYQNGVFVVVRTPERIPDFEVAAAMQVAKNLQTGLSYTYVEERLDANNNGKYDNQIEDYLPGQRIAPPELAGYVDFALLTGKLKYAVRINWYFKKRSHCKKQRRFVRSLQSTC